MDWYLPLSFSVQFMDVENQEFHKMKKKQEKQMYE